jgi:lipoate-protein ligase A
MRAALRFDPPMDGPSNMARDTELLREAAGGAIHGRVYSWSGLWVSLGRNRVELAEALARQGVPTVSRPTGGAAVLHGEDWTVALALPVPPGYRKLKPLYALLTEPIVTALVTCGLRARLAGDVPPESSSEDCFSLRAPLDVVDSWTGRKLCGCAMAVRDGGALLQASIPRRDGAEDVRRLLGAAPRALDEEELEWSDGTFPEAFASAFASWLPAARRFARV